MNSKGISEVASTILIIILVVALAGIVFAVASGTLQHYFVKKSAYIATKAGVADSPTSLLSSIPNQFPVLQPLNGDPFSLPGQQQPQASGYNVSLKILSPDGKTIAPNAQSLNGILYGKNLYIYPDPSPQASQCSYIVNEVLPNSPPPMTTGPWKVQLVDETNHVLVFTQNVNIKGITSQPVSGGVIGIGGNTMYRADCSVIPQTPHGTIPNSTYNATMNMNITHFDGHSWITLPNDPTLAFTGNMSISMWLKPTAAGDSNDPNTWHQILGKGSITGTTEKDNYQLFQIGNKMVFEWNDAVTGIHYQAITTSTPLTAGGWNYVTTSISGGTIKIYNNGVEQPLVYSQGVDPRSISTPNPNPPVMRLISTPNDVTVGKQNGDPGQEYYYNGDIGAISFYNRGLTPAEIAANLANFRA
jgi:hypothetical protein